MPIPQALRAYAHETRAAFRHTPVEVLLGVLVAATFSVTIRSHDEHVFARTLVSAAIALPLVFGLSVLRARGVISAGARWGATAAVLAAVALYGGLLFDTEHKAELWRALSLLAAAWLALSLVPVLARRRGEDGEERLAFWRFNATLLARMVTVGLYGGALFAALAGAVAAVVGLFELRNPRYLYGDLLGWIAFALVPWVVAGGLPALADALEEPAAPAVGEGGRAPRPVRLLGRWLYAPVVVVYLAILLAYTLRVAVTGEFPKNLLSPIVLLAGVGGLLGALLLEPLREDPEHRAVSRLVRVFPALLLLLLPLAFVAVLLRQDAYGWTEFRYLRLALLCALALLAVLGAARLLRKRPPLLRTVPLVFAAVLLLSAVGPWSAGAVSRRDQTARLRDALAEAGMLRGGVVPMRWWEELPDSLRRTVPEPVFDRVRSAAEYLASTHGTESLRPLFPGIPDTLQSWQVVRALPIRAGCDPRPGASGYVSAAIAPGGGVPNVAGGTLYEVSASTGSAPADTTRPVRLAVTGTELRVSGGRGTDTWTARVEMGPTVRRLAGTRRGCDGVPDRATALAPAEAVHALVDAAGRPRGQIVLRSIGVSWGNQAPPTSGGANDGGKPELSGAEGFVLLR